ncbi:MAG: hypothetical protein NWT00_07235 [Beijerinckiaceae bacterium]|nr:hypothetical protein [Beijerinckiaceae bacterium]
MPSREPSVYEQTSRPGSRAPHVWLKDGTSTLDYFGRGFVLMRLGADAPDVSAFQQAATAAGVPLTVVNNVEPDVVTAYERKLVLVRPDGHSAWRGDGVPDDPQAIIDCVRGA